MKSIKGITLISLVITIIILIILSSVGVYLTIGNNGIMNKAEYAKNETIKQTATEKMNLKITKKQMETYAEEQRMPTLQEFSDELCEDNEIEYVELQSKKLASLEKIEVGDASSIFTKLKEYPYEFEINSSLQLASIDGIQVATSGSSNNTQPTGTKFDTYICNTKTTTAIYSTVTSMTSGAFTKTTDENNKISEYLSYSDTDGYTVLKSGWYYIKLHAGITSSSASNVYAYFYINDTLVNNVRAWASGGYADFNSDSFSIYLEQGDNIYFAAYAAGNTAKTREVSGYVYPMF